jgi:hypothetical protein
MAMCLGLEFIAVKNVPSTATGRRVVIFTEFS